MRIVFLMPLLFFCLVPKSQCLQKTFLTKQDSLQGVVLKYEYKATDSYNTISLVLNKNKTYLYHQLSFAINSVSSGKWKISKNYLTLKSTLQKNNIPVRIDYGTDGDFASNSNIAIVKNIVNKPLTDVTVLVNNDSIECLPLTGQCTGSFKRIKKVKILFENGCSSKWLFVKEGATKILLTVLSEIPIEDYVVMNNKICKIECDYLKLE